MRFAPNLTWNVLFLRKLIFVIFLEYHLKYICLRNAVEEDHTRD